MPPRRRRAQHPCVVCAQFLRPETGEEPDVSCDGCSNDARVGHKRAPVAHIACILPGGTDDDDDARKGWIMDQDDDGVTTWLCQSCRRRTMDPEGAPAPAPAVAEPSPLAPAPAAVAPPPPPPPAAPEPSLPPPVAAAPPSVTTASPSGAPAAEDASYPQDFICPINQALMVDPHVCADGHSYEHDAISAWLERHDTSPQTNLPLAHKHLVPNITLRNAIIAFRSRSGVPAPAAAEPAVPRSRSRSRGRRRRSRSRSRGRRSRGRRRRSRSRSRS